jgi:hypothetical protein
MGLLEQELQEQQTEVEAVVQVTFLIWELLAVQA